MRVCERLFQKAVCVFSCSSLEGCASIDYSHVGRRHPFCFPLIKDCMAGKRKKKKQPPTGSIIILMLVRACGKTEAHTKKKTLVSQSETSSFIHGIDGGTKHPRSFCVFSRIFCCVASLCNAWMQVRFQNNNRKHPPAASTRISCSSIFHPPVNCPHNFVLSVIPSGPFLQTCACSESGRKVFEEKFTSLQSHQP